MPGTDLTARLTTWVQEAIDGAALGEDFPYTVIPLALQAGPGVLPAWTVLVLYRSPVLGAPPLVVKLDVPPAVVLTGMEANVRETVQQAMGTLRTGFRQALQALKNGGPAPVTVPVPPGQMQGN